MISIIQILLLENELREPTGDQEWQHEVVKQYMLRRGFSKEAIEQIKAMESKKKKRFYTTDQICNSLLIHSNSPKVYEILRNNHLLYHPLPHSRTLRNRIAHFKCFPGIQREFFHYLKLKFSGCDVWTNQSVLMFDEMDLCQKFEYSARMRKVFKKHKKVQVVLLRE